MKLNNPVPVILQRCRTGKMGRQFYSSVRNNANFFQTVSGGCQVFKYLIENLVCQRGVSFFLNALGDSNSTSSASKEAPLHPCWVPWLAWPRPLQSLTTRSHPFHVPLPGNRCFAPPSQDLIGWCGERQRLRVKTQALAANAGLSGAGCWFPTLKKAVS